MSTTELTDADRAVARVAGSWWWLWLVFGAAWIVVAMITLNLNTTEDVQKSVNLVGTLIGLMFIAAGIENGVLGAVTRSAWRILWWVFAVMFVIAGIYAIVNPGSTFVAVADMLGFIFLLFGIFWTIEAFATREENDLWWLGLISGILMLALAFWASSQTVVSKGITLLIFVGIFALMHGITDIFKAFALRKIGQLAR